MLDTIKNKNKNVSVVNLVFGEIYCNMDCSYCTYPKAPVAKLSRKDILTLRDNLNRLKQLIQAKFPACKVISITGGEPLLYPKVIESFAKIFPDHSIRISTNGIAINDQTVKQAKKHGGFYFAVSLDGHTLPMNSFRFNSGIILKKIINNIDLLVKNGIRIEILTTLHKKNINGFEKFLKYLTERYKDVIDMHMLWVLPSPVVDYTKITYSPTQDQINSFCQKIDSYKEISLINNIKPYYYELEKYYRDIKNRNICTMYEWAVHIKYPTDSIWKEGSFLLYGCGCRGVKILGRFDLKNTFDEETLTKRRKDSVLKDYFVNKCQICKSNCFNNWHLYDLYLGNDTNKKQISVLKNIL